MLAFAGHGHADERKLGGKEIVALLSDTTLVADGDVSQLFQAGGVTLYSVKGSQSQGFWRVDGDKYCSQWPPNEHWSCYNVSQNGNTVTFISASGTPYPMMLKTAP
jgi:hypothetical protein